MFVTHLQQENECWRRIQRRNETIPQQITKENQQNEVKKPFQKPQKSICHMLSLCFKVFHQSRSKRSSKNESERILPSCRDVNRVQLYVSQSFPLFLPSRFLFFFLFAVSPRLLYVFIKNCQKEGNINKKFAGGVDSSVFRRKTTPWYK